MSREYDAYAAAAYVFIAIYPIGIPSSFAVLLYYNHKSLSSHASSAADVGKWWYCDQEALIFLIDGYRSQTYWYELVDFLRKLLMAGVVVFVDRGSAVQFFVALLVGLIFLVVDTFSRPYADFRCNALKVLTSVAMLITLLCGFASKLDPRWAGH